MKITKIILALLLAFAVATFGLQAPALAESTENCEGGETCTHQAAIGDVHYDTLLEAVAAAEEGAAQIMLLKDVTLSQPAVLTFAGELEYTLLGNGHTVTADRIDVKEQAVLNLGAETYEGELTIISQEDTVPAITIANSGVVNMYDGVTVGPSISMGTAAGVQIQESAVFNMYGGTITECHNTGYAVSGGVLIANSGTFNMYDGLITDCSGVGGGVSVGSSNPIGGSPAVAQVVFHMYGGTIKDCQDTWLGGGGVLIYGTETTQFIMDGGKIEGCSNTSSFGYGYGGGVFAWLVAEGSFMQLNAGEISGNSSAAFGGGVFVYEGPATIADGFKLYNNTAQIAADDIFSNGADVTLGAVAQGLTLDGCDHPINGWYDDGGMTEEGTRYSYAGCNGATETYAVPFENVGQLDTEGFALKAAHGDLYTVTYSWTGAPEGAVLPTDENVYPVGSSYTVDDTFTAETVVEHTDENGVLLGKYIFSGWNDPNNGVMGNEDVTITGEWTYVEACTISFDPNNGEGNMDSEVLHPGDVMELPECPFTPPEGMEFIGWSTTPDGEILTDPIIVEEDMHLYAIYQVIETPPLTGESTTVMLWAGVLVAALGALFIALNRRSKVQG